MTVVEAREVLGSFDPTPPTCPALTPHPTFFHRPSHPNRVTVVEAREVLGSFDASLRQYAARKLIRRGVALRKGVVKGVTAREITLQVGVRCCGCEV